VTDAADPSFGDLLRRARREAGLTQEALAERAGISVRGISDLERGVIRTPRKDTLALIAEALALPAEERRRWETLREHAVRAQPDGDESGAQPSLVRLLPPPSNPVGRDHEQATLHRLLADALAGRGRLALVSGEAGIGKSTLISALGYRAADAGALVLAGGCYDLTATPPFGPWVEMATSVTALAGLPSLPPVFSSSRNVSGSGSPALLFDEAHQYLTKLAARRPLVLVLEDIHWADPASLDLLRYLARHLGGQRILLVATYRDDEIARAHPLHQLIPVVAREAGAERVKLRPLDESDVRAAVAGRYRMSEPDRHRLIDFLQGRAEGNPLYLWETLRTLEDELLLRPEGEQWLLGDLTQFSPPALIRALIENRMARIGDEPRRLLQVAAVLGQQVPLDLWQAVSGASEEALLETLETSVEAHVLTDLPERSAVRFSHALVREVLYAGLVSLRRRSMHRQAAEALIERSPGDPDAIAYHLQQAGDRRAVEWLIRAGLRARRALAYLTAGERIVTAATMLERDEEFARERGWLLFFAVDLLRFSTDPRLLDFLAEANRVALESSDRLLAAHTQHLRGLLRGYRGEIREELRDLEESFAALGTQPDRRRLRRLDGLVPDFGDQVQLAIRRLVPGVVVEVEGVDARDHAAAVHLGTEDIYRSGLVNARAAFGQYEEVLTAGEAFLAELAATGHDYIGPAQVTRYGLGASYAALGQPDAASRAFAVARRGFAAIDHALVERSVWGELIYVLIPYQTDDLPKRNQLLKVAEAAWQRSKGISSSGPVDSSPSHLVVAVLEGRWAEARQLARLWRSSISTGHVQMALVLEGSLARHQGEPEQAWTCVLELLPEGPATAPGDSHFPHAINAQALAVRLSLDAGDLEAARQWIEARERWVDWSGANLWRAENQLLWARYYREASEPEVARRHAERALQLATEPRQPLVQLAAHRFLGQLDTEIANYDSARRHLDASLALADACAVPFERGLTLLALVELHEGTGNLPEARSALDDGRSTLSRLEARPALARADHLAATLSTVDEPAAAYPAGLTRREVEVLRLVATGQTNLQIADHLFISRRTVEHHLRSIFSKLDVSSRAAATRFAVENRLT
jgi:DNA-binding CsgD family transcriptional regulator/transcriptional regulator with XRE-family HTH domain/tetratricopeptide (TPR) repeat protein